MLTTLSISLPRSPLLLFTSKIISLLAAKRSIPTFNLYLRYRGNPCNPRFVSFLTLSLSMNAPSEKLLGGILEARNDDHGGVIVEITNEPLDPGAFESLLRASLSHWKQQGKRGVWIKIPIERVNIVEAAVKEGFYFHHAEPRYLMLVHWLPISSNSLPANASHRVGVGAFVLNEKNEVLVVQEKSGPLSGKGVWKFPTGVVDEGEDICDAAVREVKEETGIFSTFVEILAFRQSHRSFFEKSDLFFVCMMQPMSFDIQPQEAEIEAAQWMPFDEYAAQPFVRNHELLRYITDICRLKKEKGEKGYSGFSPVPTRSSISNQKSFLYINRTMADISQDQSSDQSPQVNHLSKNAQKKLLKQQRFEAKKAEKKAQMKEHKKKEAERRRKEWDEKLASVGEEEKEKIIAERIGLRKERMDMVKEERGRKMERLNDAKIHGQNVVIDLDFADLMRSTELHSLVQQIMYCYALNGRCASPVHLWLTGCQGDMKELLHRIPGYDKWLIEKKDESYAETFLDKKEDLVYLTADSENVLDELDSKAIYIIGGLVDRNRWKGITMNKAKEQCIKTAKLPIGNYLKMSSSQVEAKRAVPRDDRQNSNKNKVSSIQESPSSARTKKIFVGGLASTVTDTDFRKYFDQFGTVIDAVVMYDHSTQRPRGFGFITFDSEEAANKVLTKTFHELSGKMVEVKVAVPKESSAHGLPGSHNYSLNRLGSFLNAHTQGHNSSSAGGSGMRLEERFSPVSVARSGYPPHSPSKYTIGLKLNPGYILNYGAVGDSGLEYISSPFARSPDRHHIRNKFDARGSGLLGDGTLAYGTTGSKNFGGSGNGSAGIGGNFGLIKDIWDTSLVSAKVPGNDSLRNGNLSYESWEYNNESVTTSNLSHFASGDLFFKDWPSSSFESTGSTSFTYGRGSRGITVEPIKSAGYSGFSNVSTRPDRGK